MRLYGLILSATLVLTACAHSTPSRNPASGQNAKPAYDAALSNYAYPRPVRYFSIVSQKQPLKMAYMLAGPRQAGPRQAEPRLAEPDHAGPRQADAGTVLLLHGKNFSGAYWEPTIDALVERGFRVVVPDQIGFGKSSKPEAYQFTFQQLASNTKALLDNLQIKRVSIVGHSMGGMLASRFALMYPEATERLVLVNPIGLEDWKTMTGYRTVDEHYANELKATEASIREYQRLNYFGGEWKASYEPLIDMLAGWTRHADYPRVAWNAALTADMIFTQPVVYEFPLIKTPTMLIIGQKDKTAIGKAWAPDAAKAAMGHYPELGRRAARAIPNAQLVEIPEAGHLPHIETFDRYIRALTGFLSSAPRAPR